MRRFLPAEVDRLNQELKFLNERIDTNEAQQRQSPDQPGLRSENAQLRRDRARVERQLAEQNALQQQHAQVADLQARTGSAQNVDDELHHVSYQKSSTQDELGAVEQQLANTPPMQEMKVFAEHHYSDQDVVRAGTRLGNLEFAATDETPLRTPLRIEHKWEDFTRRTARAGNAGAVHLAAQSAAAERRTDSR